MSVSSQTKAFAAQKAGGALEPFAYELAPLGPFDVEVTISHCGLCHSDLHLLDNDWGVTRYPFVPGHEIVGVVAAKGESVTALEVGQRVGIGWQCASCHTCEWCTSGEENLCAKQKPTCVAGYGGFADAIRVDSRFALPIPEAIDSALAGPLFCGGATVYSPLVTHGIQPTWRVGVIGIGGLGHLALQFAHHFGCQVTAISSHQEKEGEAKQFGADHFALLSDLSKLKNTFDMLIVSSIGDLNGSALLATLRPKGNVCLVGVPKKALTVHPFDLIDGRKILCGSNIASPGTIQEMLAFAAEHGVAPQIELFPMEEANTAFKRLKENTIRYRAVLFHA